ncbi:MAG TPA: hypothetical protein VF803_00230, partial [Candidatus Paceibacterota bacterium]
MKKIFNFQFSITRHPGLLRRFSKAPSGFTLIESFVAITILVTAIAGPLSIASNSLRAALVASNQVSASFLAQEAIEYIRYTRDSNRLSGNAWTTYLNNCISANGSQACYIDATKSASVSGAINACTG